MGNRNPPRKKGTEMTKHEMTTEDMAYEFETTFVPNDIVRAIGYYCDKWNAAVRINDKENMKVFMRSIDAIEDIMEAFRIDFELMYENVCGIDEIVGIRFFKFDGKYNYASVMF